MDCAKLLSGHNFSASYFFYDKRFLQGVAVCVIDDDDVTEFSTVFPQQRF